MNTKNNQKVRLSEKLGLFMVYAGNIPLMTLLSAYFLIYYTTVVGLDPMGLSTLFLISKAVDGVSDPVMGFIMDRFPVTKRGKFRPMLVLGTIICVINYILLWFGAAWSPVGKYAIVYVTYLLLGWTFDIMDISKNSLVPVMSADSKERNSLSLFAALGTMAGAAVLGVVSPLIVAEATLENYYILIFGSMAMVLVLSLVGVTFVKERVGFEGKKEEKYSLKELVSFLRYKPVWSFFILALVAGTGSTIAGGAGTFFYTYVMGDLTLASGVTVISLVAALIGIFLGPILANRMGKKNVYLLCIVISIIFTALRLIDVRSMTLIYISSLCGGIAGGCLQPLNTSIQADNTTYVQYKTGKRAEAAIASLTSFITKVAQGLGGAIPGYVLAAFGFVEGSVQQPESINTGIILCVLILPMILTGLGAILFGTQYTLDKKAVEEMHASLAEGKQE